MRPIQATINLQALKSNFTLVKKLANKSKVMAVLKANAYGHGLIEVANALEQTDGISVLNLDEAIKLREAGFNRTILLLEGFFEVNEVKVASKLGLNVTVHNQIQIDLIDQAKPINPIDIHLKINTGMNRLGFSPNEIDYLLESLNSNQYVGEITLMTHFSTADEKVGINKQLNIFTKISNNYNYDSSVANSAALIKYPESRLDWVRPGIMLYGASPYKDISAESIGLKPVMNLMSQVIAIQHINIGDSVGYGSVFRAQKSMKVGVVACGYADGYPRHASTGTPVFIDNIFTTTIGRVSMDMLYVDITNIPNIDIGSSVELWGSHVPVDEIAKHSNTVGYELLCSISASKRVPLDYISG